MGLGGVVRGGLWLYVGGLLSSLLAYVYWLLASRIVGPSVVGSAAAVVAFSSLIVGLLGLGLPTGLMRFIGLSLGRGDFRLALSYSASTLLFTAGLDIAAAIILILLYQLGCAAFSLSGVELFTAAVLVALNWYTVLTSTFNAMLRAELTALAQLTSAAVRLTAGITLLYLGFGFVGIMMGYIASSLTTDLLLLTLWLKVKRGVKPEASLKLVGDNVKAGLASWIPDMLTIIGQQIGVLSLYGLVGRVETGLYYVAFAIASIVYSLPTSILSLSLPMLSGLSEGRDRAALRATRLSLATATPVALILAAYPHLPLQLLGQNYLEAAQPLRILALGVLASTIVSGYSSYIYAEGRYSHVTTIGLVGNGSRLALYSILVGYGESGVALAYTLGFLAALLATIPSSAKTGFKQEWGNYAKTIIIPTSVVLILYSLNIHWSITIPLTAVASAFAYARLRIVEKSDLIDVSEAILSKERLSRIYTYAKPIIKLIYGE